MALFMTGAAPDPSRGFGRINGEKPTRRDSMAKSPVVYPTNLSKMTKTMNGAKARRIPIGSFLLYAAVTEG